MSGLEELARRMMLYGLNIGQAHSCAAVAIDYAEDRVREEIAKIRQFVSRPQPRMPDDAVSANSAMRLV